MTDEQDRPTESRSEPTTSGSDDSALDRDDLQEIQDDAGIAGEPQPTETDTASEAANEAEAHPS